MANRILLGIYQVLVAKKSTIQRMQAIISKIETLTKGSQTSLDRKQTLPVSHLATPSKPRGRQ